MILKCLTPPGVEPITLADVENQCRIDSLSDESAAIDLFIAATRQRAEAVTRRALITQQWRLTVDGFPGCNTPIAIPLPPLQSVDSITYVDTAGITQTLDPELYRVITDDEPARLLPLFEHVWPSTRGDIGMVSITFTCGYGDNHGAVPAAIRQWMLLNVANLYENRESLTAAPGRLTMVDLTTMADSLLHDFRVFTF